MTAAAHTGRGKGRGESVGACVGARREETARILQGFLGSACTFSPGLPMGTAAGAFWEFKGVSGRASSHGVTSGPPILFWEE